MRTVPSGTARRFLRTAFLFAALASTAALPHSARAQGNDETSQKIGDWTLKCRGAPAAGGCVLVQDIIFRQSGKRVLNVSIVGSGQKNANVVAITAPLGILLPAGLTLVMDDTEAVKFPLRLCNVNGCQGSFPFASDVKNLFFNAAKGQVMFRQPNGRPLRVNFSLNGFKEAFAAFQTQTGAKPN
jgi:invasion protein IalB